MVGVNTCHIALPLINNFSLTSHLKFKFQSRALWTILMGRRLPSMQDGMQCTMTGPDGSARSHQFNMTAQDSTAPLSPQQFGAAQSLFASPETPRNMGYITASKALFKEHMDSNKIPKRRGHRIICSTHFQTWMHRRIERDYYMESAHMVMGAGKSWDLLLMSWKHERQSCKFWSKSKSSTTIRPFSRTWS